MLAIAGLSLGTDIKRYSRGTLPRIALATIVLLPLLYGAMYLWAFWNPFSEVNRLPVALVNEDLGAQTGQRHVNAGDQVAEQLLSSGELDLHPVSAEEAAKGVKDGRYYFSITIPADFSAAVASPDGEQPRAARLQFTYNNTNNYLASIIGQNAARDVAAQVDAAIGRQTVGQVLEGVEGAGAGLSRAAGGADELRDGLVQADDGAHRLASGSAELSKGLVTARDGSGTLAAGARELSGGINTATDPLLSVLDRVSSAGLNPDEVGALAADVSGLASTATDRLASLHFDQAQAAVIVDQVIGFLRANPDPTVRALGDTLAGSLRLLRAQNADPTTEQGLITLRDKAAALQAEFGDPNSELRTFLTRALTGGLRSDVVRLRDGAAQLSSGANQLNGGLVALANGGRQVSQGAVTLADGTGRLRGGSAELAAGLHQGADQVPKWTDRQRTDVAQTLARPVVVDQVVENPAATFGTGFAPFFLPLALFIGALIIWMLLTPLQARPVVNGLGALRVVLATYWPALLIAFAQVLVMYAVVHFGVGLKATHTAGTVLFLTLVAAAFLALIQSFNALFGVAVGRVVTLAFLMFQLVSAGGIYPVETTPKPFQVLHVVDPMTYAVNGLRQLTVGGIDSRLGVAIAVLTGILAAALAASSWAARRNRQYTMERLKPPVEV